MDDVVVDVKVFDKFKKAAVAVSNTPKEVTIGGKQYNLNNYKLSESDPTISEIKKLAESLGLTTRIWLPESMGTMDWRTDRLNVYIDHSGDAFAISDITIG